MILGSAKSPLIIQAAITGSITDRASNPNVPMDSVEIIASALAAERAGASVLHLHGREADGTPTQDIEAYREVVDGLKAAGCSSVLNLSTGSGGGRVSGRDRWACIALGPEMASYDCGSMNFGDWVFENSVPMLREMAIDFTKAHVKPEIECFDTGHVATALRLRAEGLLVDPIHFQFVLGVPGGARATFETALAMRAMLPDGATWSICGIGRAQLPMNLLCISGDGHVRTGLEDNSQYWRGRPAASNAELVGRVVRIAREVGREVASPSQAREILGLPSPAGVRVASAAGSVGA